jgi:hypothetical protein
VTSDRPRLIALERELIDAAFTVTALQRDLIRAEITRITLPLRLTPSNRYGTTRNPDMILVSPAASSTT